MGQLLVIDVGGTNIKYSTWDGELGEVKEVPTPTDTAENFLSEIEKMLKETGPVDGIALSYPGFIDTETGIKHGGGNLRYTDNISVTKLIRDKFGLPVSIENDSKSATLAEMEYGSLKDYKNAVTLILGTGVGGTVVVDGKILRGTHLVAGEFSFIKTDIREPQEWNMIAAMQCASLGLSECVAQTTGIEGLNGRQIFEKINNGDEKALEGLKNFCKQLCWLIYNLEVVTDPEIFVIGGGISAQPMLLKTLKETLNEYYEENGFGLAVPNVEVCQFRNNANLIGAAINYYMHYPDHD